MDQTKNPANTAITTRCHAFSGPRSGLICTSATGAGGASDFAPFATGVKTRIFSNTFTPIIPAAVEKLVASRAVPTIAYGACEPAAARTAMAVMGNNCTELVLIARKVHIAFV